MIPQEFSEKDFQGWGKKLNKAVTHMRNIVMYIQTCHLRKESNLHERHVKDSRKILFMLLDSSYSGYFSLEDLIDSMLNQMDH